MSEKISALHFDHQIGLFGDHEGKTNLLKIKELKDLKIIQIAKFKKSQVDLGQVKIDGLNLPLSSPLVSSNVQTRILWIGPDTWLCISKNIRILDDINSSCDGGDFGITDISHSRAAIQIQGDHAIDVLKKGSPLNFNENIFCKNNSANTTYNGINIIIDYIDDNQKIFEVYALRSFGGSFYHSITDSSLEFGYEGL
jgi:heterotetrameric sarcosine oxidase gamma subunit